MSLTRPSDAPGTRTDPDVDTAGETGTRVLQVLVGLIVVAAVAAPVLATMTGVRDGFMVNGDEAVAALLPVEFARGGPVLLFPGNTYQGVLEVPVYAVLWWIAGPHELPMRLFHQVVWVGALAVWAWCAIEVVGRSRGASRRARWWGALGVAGLLGVTSVAGWPVWFRIYPGYQLGALLAGIAVWLTVGGDRARRWVLAGFLAGLAVYEQPMHVAGALAVLVAAVVTTDAAMSRSRRVGSAVVGMFAGVSPLVLWNLRNSFATLGSSTQPVAHPEWGYLDRSWNTARVTARVLWGDASTPPGSFGALRFLVGAILVGLVLLGVVALVRVGRGGLPLLSVVAVCLLGLPALKAFSLDVDDRYAVGWWPGLVVAVAAGVVVVATSEDLVRRIGLGALCLGLVAHLAVVVSGARSAVEHRSRWPSAEAETLDLARDLRRCGVDAVAGDYWVVYPAVWASDARVAGGSFFGPERLAALAPAAWSRLQRVAVLPPTAKVAPGDAANLVTARTGRGRDGWISATHPGTGVVVMLERTAQGLPDGCLGGTGLRAG